MSVPEDVWRNASGVLSDATDVVLACHVGPDGDALGSMLALGLAMRARGASVAASWGSEPFEVPRAYRFLPGLDLLVPPERFPARPDVMVTFDAGSIARLGSLEPNARAAATLLVVDHHATNESFGTINLVDPSSAASAVLVHELLARLGWDYGADVATCLYVGVLTDTGRFQYSNTTPAIHSIAADLLARGVEHTAIAERLYGTHPIGYLKVAAAALDRVSVRDGVVWTWVTQDDLARAGVGIEETDALIDLVRTAEDVDVAAVLKQQTDGRFRVSMRSRGATNVGALCESFGGGGHALAAGFTADNGDPHTTIERIVASLDRARV